MMRMIRMIVPSDMNFSSARWAVLLLSACGGTTHRNIESSIFDPIMRGTLPFPSARDYMPLVGREDSSK
jgi:hypothetical protein